MSIPLSFTVYVDASAGVDVTQFAISDLSYNKTNFTFASYTRATPYANYGQVDVSLNQAYRHAMAINYPVVTCPFTSSITKLGDVLVNKVTQRTQQGQTEAQYTWAFSFTNGYAGTDVGLITVNFPLVQQSQVPWIVPTNLLQLDASNNTAVYSYLATPNEIVKQYCPYQQFLGSIVGIASSGDYQNATGYVIKSVYTFTTVTKYDFYIKYCDNLPQVAGCDDLCNFLGPPSASVTGPCGCK